MASLRDSSKPRLPAVLRRFARNQRGATAIEFAVLSVPFFGLVGALLQTAMVFLATQIFDTAVYDASRIIQTGQAQSLSYTHTKFRQLICNGLYGIFDCSAIKLKVTVATANTITSPLQANGQWTASWAAPTDYNSGQGSTIIQIQAFYKWPVPINIGGLFNGAVGVSQDGTKLLGVSYVFKNEPFT